MMIFFTTEVAPFKSKKGMQILPSPKIKLKDGRSGYTLGVVWEDEIKAKGIAVDYITKDDIDWPELN